MLRLTASRSRRRAASILNKFSQENHHLRGHAFFSPPSPTAPTPRVSANTIRASTGDFNWPDEYSWMDKSRNAEEFGQHLAAELTFASAALAELAPLTASLAAEARRYVAPADPSSSSSSPFDDSVPERIGDYFYFTRTGGGGSSGSCSLLRRRVSNGDGGAESAESRAESAELVVDVAAVAASQGASSLGQLKLSPCEKAVAMTLDVSGSGGGGGGGSGGGGGGGEFWRAVVVEVGGRREEEILGAVDGVTSVEWGAPPPNPSSSSSPGSQLPLLSLPPLFYTRDGAGAGSAEDRAGGGRGPAAATLHCAPWDEAARRFLFFSGDESSHPSSSSAAAPPAPLFSEPDPSRVLALGRSKDGALLTLASAAAGGSAAYALWLRGGDGGGAGGGAAAPPSLSSASTPPSSLPTPPSRPVRLTCVAPFEEGVEHYLEHCEGVPGGLVVMTTAAAMGSGAGSDEEEAAGEFWLAAPLAGAAAAAAAAGPSNPPSSVPPPSNWRALLPPRRGDGENENAAAVLTDIDVQRDCVLCYQRCPSTGRPRLSLLRWGWGGLGGVGGGVGGAAEVKEIALPSPSENFLVVRPGANADPDARTARVTLSGPLAPPEDFDLCLETGEWRRPLPSPSSSSSPALPGGVGEGLEVAIEMTPGGVPVTLVRRKKKIRGKDDDHNQQPRPVLLTLYGCYGLSVDPSFDPVRLALAAAARTSEGGGGPGGGFGGGFFDLAFAHLRGGGELGRAWHAAGRGENRRRVAEDAREVVEWLSSGNGSGSSDGSGESDGGSKRPRRRRRRPVALVAESAGALVAGALLADSRVSPLLSAVSLRVPFVDVLAGVAEGDEEDDEEDERQRRRQRSLFEHERGEFSAPAAAPSALAAVCPYFLLSEFERTRKSNNNPLPGPPVLVTLAENDARVPAASVAKWVSRLRRLRGSSSSGGCGKGGDDSTKTNPVLLEVLRGCGHAEGLRSEEDIEANAREAAFLVAATEKWREEEEENLNT